MVGNRGGDGDCLVWGWDGRSPPGLGHAKISMPTRKKQKGSCLLVTRCAEHDSDGMRPRMTLGPNLKVSPADSPAEYRGRGRESVASESQVGGVSARRSGSRKKKTEPHKRTRVIFLMISPCWSNNMTIRDVGTGVVLGAAADGGGGDSDWTNRASERSDKNGR